MAKLTKRKANAPSPAPRLQAPLSPIAVELPAYVIDAAHTPADLPEWWPRYLKALSLYGLQRLAACSVGISPRAVRYQVHDRPALVEAEDEAREYFGDCLEHENVRLGLYSGNPLSSFGRLKADRPERYNERMAIVSTSVSLSITGNAAEADALLARMLQLVRPSERAALVPRVVEGEVVDSQALAK